LLFAGSAVAQRYAAEIQYVQLKSGTLDTQAAGGTFSVALNKNFAFETTLNFFPENNPYPSNPSNVRGGSRAIQGLFGVKARIIGTDRFTLSAKVRPGFVSYGNVVSSFYVYNPPSCTNSLTSFSCTSGSESESFISSGRKTAFAFDFGGVLDVTTSKHTFLSLEFGATTIHYPVVNPQLPENALPSTTVNGVSSLTTTNLQLSTGFGVRF
jgi:hypothetical protein